MGTSAQELMTIAKSLLHSDAPLPERIEGVEQYVNNFDTWYDSFQSGGEEQTVAQELLTIHNELVIAAERWLKEASVAIADQKKKGRVIMAYADSLPKRLSRYRAKKG